MYEVGVFAPRPRTPPGRSAEFAKARHDILCELREEALLVMAGAVLGGFLLKVAGLIALTASLRNLDFYDPWVLFVTLAVAAFASLIVDVVTVQRARLPIIDQK